MQARENAAQGANAEATRRQGGEGSGLDVASHPVIFFDGVCGLCNRFVDFVLPRDPGGVFRFAPLQGETARAQLGAEEAGSLESVVLLDEAGTHRQSTAVIRVLRRLGGAWALTAWLIWVVPLPIRNLGYKLIARNRYRLFGKKDACRMPMPEERSRFLP